MASRHPDGNRLEDYPHPQLIQYEGQPWNSLGIALKLGDKVLLPTSGAVLKDLLGTASLVLDSHGEVRIRVGF